MNFYEDRVSIVKMNEREIYIFKNKKNEISMDYYNAEEGHKNISICNDAYGEFDIIVDKNKINLIYQNTKNYLRLLSIDKLLVEDIELFKERLAKVYEIKMNINNGLKSIIYLIPKLSEKGVFEIYHNILKNGEWIKLKVDDTRISMFLNPIKVLNDGKFIYLFYYYENQICMKLFSIEELKWKETTVLTNNAEKLYIDVIKDRNYIHLVYSEYIDQNLSIRYKRYEYKGDSLYETIDKTVSNKGNTTHPTLILNRDKIWVVWRDSFGLNSVFSNNSGEIFSNIYLWKESKLNKYVRYDYKEKEQSMDFRLNSSFGTIYPNIGFLGFGELNNTEEIIRKNKIGK